jgi:hypothetical protein
MSFAVSLKAEDGQVELTNISGTVPDGSYTISGHTDEAGSSLSVSVSYVRPTS